MLINEKYPSVFQPLKIRNVVLKNRLQFAPTVCSMCDVGGFVGAEMIEYIDYQARTGVGYITIGDTQIELETGAAWIGELDISNDKAIRGLAQLAETTRKHGAEISIELSHAGRGAVPSMISGQALAPSNIPIRGGAQHLKVMDEQDMEHLRNKYVECALRCKRADFKIVMIHCAHNNLLGQFLSPSSNIRTDEYGGSAENRRRYPLSVLKSVREALGPNMVIEIRVSATEDTEGGLEFEESLEFMKAAQEYVDIIHISRGNIFTYGACFTIPTYLKGRLLNVDFAQRAKKVLHVPVAVVGMITSLAEAEAIISSGKADIVAMAKSLMADPELIGKSLVHKEAEIRPCIRCDYGCGLMLHSGHGMHCSINPTLGHNITIKNMIPPNNKKNVMVIGGGPAGLTATQTLREMGHFVTLYEKSDRLGGLLHDATSLPFKEYLSLYKNWTIRATENSGAKIMLNTEVTLALIEQENPDAIIIATGSTYVIPDLTGIHLPIVKMAADVDRNPSEVGNKVVVCGGGLTGIECALGLGMLGKEVTVIDMLPTKSFLSQMPIIIKTDLLYQLKKHKVQLLGNKKIISINESGVLVKIDQDATHFLEADTVVNAMGVVPNDGLSHVLRSKYPTDVYVVGDCNGQGKNIYHANQEAYFAAIRIK